MSTKDRRLVLGAVALLVLSVLSACAWVAQPVAVFLGDSFTQGASAGDGSRFTTLVARERGWREVNLGIGGTGYLASVSGDFAMLACGKSQCPSYAGLIEEVARQQPDVVVVSGGYNERAVGTSAQWRDGVVDFFARLHEAVPDATILATSPIWDDDPVPPELSTMREVVRSGVAAVGGTYVDLGDPLLNHPELVDTDGVHPNAAGHQAIADAFNAAY